MQAMAAAAAVGKIVQGVGGLVAGNANARALKRQSREELALGVAEETRVREAARASDGELIAAQFANGMMGGTGSALDALRESKVNAALDILQIRRQSMGKAMALRAQAKQEKTRGRFALLEGVLGAASSVNQMSSDWADARRGQSAPPKSPSTPATPGTKGPAY